MRMFLAFCAALLLAAFTLAFAGAGVYGTNLALAVTGRFSFLLFWPAYTGSALIVLFGNKLLFMQRNGRDLGLAFASAHLVHLSLVVWLSLIGVVLSIKTYVIFGLATIFLYMLSILSFDRLRSNLGPRGWWWLRFVGMNYIALAFATDFLRPPVIGSLAHAVAYIPFSALIVVGPILRLIAFIVQGESRVVSGTSD